MSNIRTANKRHKRAIVSAIARARPAPATAHSGETPKQTTRKPAKAAV